MANYIRYMLRADNEANWKSKNPVLLKGEPGFDMTNNRLKIGDGSNTWTIAIGRKNVSIHHDRTNPRNRIVKYG